MNVRFKKIIFLTFSLLTLSMPLSFSCDIHGKTGFMPKNDLYISKHSFVTNGMTEEKFHSIINRVFEAYDPIIKEKGGRFSIVSRWDDGEVNAYAYRSGSMWVVNMFGGLARHPVVTDDALMLVVCHETGHHLGGAPKYAGVDWCSNEGQADYFGALKCMKRVLQNDNNVDVVSRMQIDEEVVKKCELIYKSTSEVALCKRTSMAGKSLALLLASIGDNNPNISFNTPDKKITKETEDTHPASQCRLDTFFNGSLCDKSFTEDLSETDPISGTCVKRDGYVDGIRPLCWYRPGAGE